MKNTWLHRYCLLLASATLLMVVAGSLVQGSGIEKLHRVLGMIVGTIAIGLVVWLWIAEPRRWLRWVGVTALLLVVLQGAMGMMSARVEFPAGVKILHACLAQTFFAVAALLALFTSGGWKESAGKIEDSGWPPLRYLGMAAPVGVLGQAALGAGYRHGALGVMPHVAGALAVAGLVMMLSLIVLTQHSGSKSVARPAKSLLIITLHQIPLGVLAYFLRISFEGDGIYGSLATGAVTAHVAVGALMVAWSAVTAAQIHRATGSAAQDNTAGVH